MFKVGDKVVPNGFRADGDKHYNGTEPKMIEWEERSKVLTVKNIDKDGCISATDGNDGFHYHPSELRIATEKEIEALNKTEEQSFEFDFDNYFYVLELKDSIIFIASHENIDENIWGVSDEYETNAYCIEKDDIKKIIAIIPRR